MRGLKIKRVKKRNPRTGEMGYSVDTRRGMHVEWDDLLEMATRGTTCSRGEAEMAWGLIVDELLDQLKDGNSVELRGLGRLRVQVGAPWRATPQELHKADVHASLRFEPHWRLKRWMQRPTLHWFGKLVFKEDKE